MVSEVKSDTFDSEVLASPLPVLVDVWAPWCGPCHMIAPIVESIANEFEGRVRVLKLNADENPEILRRYTVMGIPTLLFFHHGHLVHRSMGVQPEAIIRGHLTRIMSLTAEEAASQKVRGAGGALSGGVLWLALTMILVTLIGILIRML